MAYLKINNIDFSDYIAGLKCNYETLLSSDSGRNAAGDNVVDIVNRKGKIEATFTPMTATEMQTFMTAIEDFVFSLTFLNPKTGNLSTITAYCGTPALDYYKIKAGDILFKPFQISLIEM